MTSNSEIIRGMAGSTLKLLHILSLEANEKGELQISLEELASATGLTQDTVRWARADLVERGVLEIPKIAGGRGHKATYKLAEKPEGFKDKPPPHKGGNINLLKSFYILRGEESKEVVEVKKRRSKRKDKKGSEKYPTLSMTDELLTFQEGCRILGIPCYPNSAWANLVRRSLRTRIKEGYSREDLMNACRYAEDRFTNGDRWHKWKDLIYIWSRGLSSLLASKTEKKTKGGAGVFRKGKEQEEWIEGVKGRVKG